MAFAHSRIVQGSIQGWHVKYDLALCFCILIQRAWQFVCFRHAGFSSRRSWHSVPLCAIFMDELPPVGGADIQRAVFVGIVFLGCCGVYVEFDEMAMLRLLVLGVWAGQG